MVLQQPAKNELMKYLKLEAGWILTNLAYGTEEELILLLEFKQQTGFYTHINFITLIKEIIEANL